MRFRKGSKVEVLNEKDVPLGSWKCAEIISGNGHCYYVKYDCFPGNMGAAVERVPRKAIRPCPPAVQGSKNWVHGDIVEVFDLDSTSWKLAEVLSTVGGNYFYVRHLGSPVEYKVHSLNIRLRQSWQDNKWTIIRKDSGKCSGGTMKRFSKEGKSICQTPQPWKEVKHWAEEDNFTVVNDVVFEEHPQGLTKDMKKRPYVCSPPVGTCTGASRKMRAVEREGRCYRLVAEQSPNLQKKGQSWRLAKLASKGPI